MNPGTVTLPYFGPRHSAFMPAPKGVVQEGLPSLAAEAEAQPGSLVLVLVLVAVVLLWGKR